jgi:hypothetical protein
MLLLPVIVFFAGLIALAAASVVGGDMRRVERILETGHGLAGRRG